MTPRNTSLYAFRVAANLLHRANRFDAAGLHRLADSVEGHAIRQAQYLAAQNSNPDAQGYSHDAQEENAPDPFLAASQDNLSNATGTGGNPAQGTGGNPAQGSDPFSGSTGAGGQKPLTPQDIQGMASADFHTPQWQSYLRYLSVTDPQGFQQLLSTVGWDRLYQAPTTSAAPVQSQDDIHKQEADKLIAQGIFVPGYSQGEAKPGQPIGMVVKPGEKGNTFGPSAQQSAEYQQYMANWKRDQPFQYADYVAQHPQNGA